MECHIIDSGQSDLKESRILGFINLKEVMEYGYRI